MILCVFGLSFALAEDFITLKEYAKMLYENPRGISCKECHGADGASQVLGYYTKKGEKEPFTVPSIQNLSFEAFKEALIEDKDTKSIMPTYSLTPSEIVTLYNYIQELNKEKK
ncbi:c-type cytochrome [Campylobacter sp. MIT 97-5078]|uniref:c-type cytochrome n=1 Tax=Campylobacter sp. MIT 97-5078 TaxID=1548153 RepID=UPI0005142E2A|nr:c-type cytochrome [Campylobacter sp. MIT 97-5078]KGI57004.1 hypothetical protein LR59_03995 [Campylobacter sp. MIT 97-5078]TQR28311.1 hypothetical protein DMB91_00450 [Campylobacter sp. MIT 97-5078]